jgi:uncharacterized protein YcfL
MMALNILILYKIQYNSNMLNFFRNLYFFLIFLMLIVSCTTINTNKRNMTEAPVERKTSINLSRSHKECVEVHYNQIMRYSFKTSKPVNFNIHYQGKDDRIYYADSKNNISQTSGVLIGSNLRFYAGEQAPYCLLWQNPQIESVNLDLEYTVR